MTEFEYQALPDDTAYVADINESSPSFDFDTGKSYFVSLELPPFKQAYGVSIKSFALGEHIDKSHIFFPKVIVLDNNHSIVNEVTQQSFKISQASIIEAAKENKWGLPVKIEGSVIVGTPRIRYLVVLTTDHLLSESSSYMVQRNTPVILPDIIATVPLYKEMIQIPHSPFGRLSVRRKNEPANSDRVRE